MKNKSLPVRHVGYLALCDGKHGIDNITSVNLGVARYKRLGVRERFKGEAPYRVCKRCIAKLL